MAPNPLIPHNGDCQALVNTTDLFTTILELANSDSGLPQLHDSYSLLPLLTAGCDTASSDSFRGYIYAENGLGMNEQSTLFKRDKTIRNRDGYKLKLDHFINNANPAESATTWEFFDLKDCTESVSLVDSSTGDLLVPQPSGCGSCPTSAKLAERQANLDVLKLKLGPIAADGNLAAATADSDHDGTAEASDNCPGLFNPDQADLNGDGEGDACDSDLDGDVMLNVNDACDYFAEIDPTDTSGDGVPNECQCGDTDGNGVLQAGDAFNIATCVTAGPCACGLSVEISDTDNNLVFQSGDAFNIASTVTNPTDNPPHALTCPRRPEGTAP